MNSSPGRWLAVLLTVLANSPAAAMEPVTAPIRDASGFVGFLPAQSVALTDEGPLPAMPGRLLSSDAATARAAWLVEVPAGYRGSAQVAPLANSVELVVLSGSLSFGESNLGVRDFAFVPPRGVLPLLASDGGATMLVFLDPPAPDPVAVERQRERGSYVTHYDETRWLPASVARGAGLDLDLRVQHLKKDPFTHARTWYVKLAGGMSVPWERHSVVEEGFLLEGDYRIAECLPGRTVFGEYQAGGYFWRPGGIPHSGPGSGTQRGAVWLQRSPAALDVVFYAACEAGRASEPLRKP